MKTILIVLIFGITSLGCSQGFRSFEEKRVPGIGDSGNFPLIIPIGGDSAQDNLKLVPGAITTSVVYSGQILRNMVAVSGIEFPSSNTRQYWDSNKGTFSESGKANTVNAPMLLSIMGLSSEVCNDLIGIERNKAVAERRIFPDVNFGSAPGNITDAAKDDMIRRMARSFWSRNETDSERTMLKTALDESIGMGPQNATGTEAAALFLCSAMLGSLDSIQL